MSYVTDTFGRTGWTCQKCGQFVDDFTAHVCPKAEIKVSQLTPSLLTPMLVFDGEAKATLKSIQHALTALEGALEDIADKLQNVADCLEVLANE